MRKRQNNRRVNFLKKFVMIGIYLDIRLKRLNDKNTFLNILDNNSKIYVFFIEKYYYNILTAIYIS